MYAWYEINYYIDFNSCIDTGIAFGENEEDIIKNLKKYYGEFDKVSISFTEEHYQNIIPNELIENQNPYKNNT